MSFQNVISPLMCNYDAYDNDLKIVKASIVTIIICVCIFIDSLIVVVNGLTLMFMHKDKGAHQ